jgi:hypothetical protein
MAYPVVLFRALTTEVQSSSMALRSRLQRVPLSSTPPVEASGQWFCTVQGSSHRNVPRLHMGLEMEVSQPWSVAINRSSLELGRPCLRFLFTYALEPPTQQPQETNHRDDVSPVFIKRKCSEWQRCPTMAVQCGLQHPIPQMAKVPFQMFIVHLENLLRLPSHTPLLNTPPRGSEIICHHPLRVSSEVPQQVGIWSPKVPKTTTSTAKNRGLYSEWGGCPGIPSVRPSQTLLRGASWGASTNQICLQRLCRHVPRPGR